MDRVINLPVHGRIHHGPEDDLSWELYRTGAMARLRDISLSSTPSRFVPYGHASSRFHHSVGVAYLARILARRLEPVRPLRSELIASALLHDAASSPFSHISEPFLYARHGVTHEAATARILDTDDVRAVLGRHGVDRGAVHDTITGRHPVLGPLIAGSVDADNADNSLTLILSLGYQGPLPYEPRQLMNAFVTLDDGRIGLDSQYLDVLLGWRKTRTKLYETLHADPQRSTAVMLYRAMEIADAHGELPDEFFAWGESHALIHLFEGCGTQTTALMKALDTWHLYPKVFESSSEEIRGRIRALAGDVEARRTFTDALADMLGVARHLVCVYAGANKGEKAIHLPFTGDQAQAAQLLFGPREARHTLSVFAADHAAVPTTRVEQAVSELLEKVHENADGHIFF